jgi:hypothetical protein
MPLTPPEIVRNGLLARDAYIRVLPVKVQKETRIRLDAVTFAVDTIEAAYAHMNGLASNFDWGREGSAGRRGDGVISLYQQAWSIVDQVHNLRCLLPGLGVNIDEIDRFIKEFECATLMRNRIDHLDLFIPNIAKSKGHMPGIHGSLTYTFVPPDDVIETSEGFTARGGFLVLHQVGPVMENQLMCSVVPSAPRYSGVSNFQLQAYDWELKIDNVILRLAPLMKALNTFAEESIKAQIAAMSKETGRPEAELSGHSGAGISFKLRFLTGTVGGGD